MPEIIAPAPSDFEMYAGIKVIESQQVDINRRLEGLESGLVDPARVTALELASASRSSWTTWLLQTAGTVIVTALVLALMGLVGGGKVPL